MRNLTSTPGILLALLAVLFEVISIQAVHAQPAPIRQKKFDKIYTTATEYPRYPDGDAQFRRYLNENLRYPQHRVSDNIQGIVYVAFIIGSDGLLYNFTVDKGLGPGFDEEAMRVLSQSRQPWTPAKLNGEPIDFRMIIPVTFLNPEMQALAIEKAKAEEADNALKIFTVVEETPVYPGGQPVMYEHINKSIRYPEDARKAGIEGRVFISFVLDKEGKMSTFKVEKGLFPSLDAEAIRVVSNLPGKWQPAKQNGRPVNYRYILPIKFMLESLPSTDQDKPGKSK